MTMRNHKHFTRLLLPAVLLAVAGCFKLSRESPPVQHYVLSGAAQTSADGGTRTTTGTSSATATRGLTLGLRRLDLASYLSVPSILLRRGDNKLDVSEFHRWGEELEEGINRVVASHLRNSPPVAAVDVAPWQPRAAHDYLVQLHVMRFEGEADSASTQGHVHVRAGWDIIRAVDGSVLMRGSTDDRGGSFRVGDYAGLVTELDAALSRVARDISACLSRFPNDSTPPATCAASAAASGAGR